MKRCIKCKVEKDLLCFSKGGWKNTPRNTCRQCQSLYRKTYYSKNKHKENINNCIYKKKFSYKVNAINMKRHYGKKNAAPPWLTEHMKKEIEGFYKESRWLSNNSKDRYVVDHIIPLNGKDVCGLHVPWNLQVITFIDNCKKGNKYGECSKGRFL